MSQEDEPKYNNILKVRDDHLPIAFAASEPGKFRFKEGTEISWLSGEEFSLKELRSRIEPWLTSLFQSEHLSFLAGSGLTHAVHYLAADKAAAGMGAVALSCHEAEINKAAAETAEVAGRSQGNFEDQLRSANELLRGLEILGDKDAGTLRKDLKTILTQSRPPSLPVRRASLQRMSLNASWRSTRSSRS